MAPVSLRVSRKFAQATEPRQKSFCQKSGEISISHDFGSLAGFVTVLSPGREDMALNPNQAQRRVLAASILPAAFYPLRHSRDLRGYQHISGRTRSRSLDHASIAR
jgi:hypothetical protein